MGIKGPIPQRDDTLARPRIRKGGNPVPVTKGVLRDVTVPEPDPEWHKIARMFWDGLATSGQSDYYQNSDWAVAFLLCDDITNYLSGNRSAVKAGVIYSALGSLLPTEADRRRVRIELHSEAPVANLASVTAISEYEKELGVS